MKRITIDCRAIFLLLFFSCLGHADVTNVPFREVSVRSADMNLEVIGQADAKSGSISLELSVTNKTSRKLALDWSSIQLSSPQGWRTAIRNKKTAGYWSVGAGKDKTMVIDFLPVNSLAVYKLDKVRGDLEPEYELSFKTRQRIDYERITVDFERSVYKKYLADYGVEKNLNLHLPLVDREIFIPQQKEYLRRYFSREFEFEPHIEATSDKILLNGIAFRFRMYQRNKNIEINLQLVNRSDYSVSLDSEKINLKTHKKWLNPENSFEGLPKHKKSGISKKNANVYYVKPGERFSWNFSFDGKFKRVSPELDVRGIQIRGKAMFSEALSFSRVESLDW